MSILLEVRRGRDRFHAGFRRTANRARMHGKQIHDCNIVATMKVHGVRRLATRNPDDFKRFHSVVDVERVD